MSDMPVADEGAASSGGESRAGPRRPDHDPDPECESPPPPAREPSEATAARRVSGTPEAPAGLEAREAPEAPQGPQAPEGLEGPGRAEEQGRPDHPTHFDPDFHPDFHPERVGTNALTPASTQAAVHPGPVAAAGDHHPYPVEPRVDVGLYGPLPVVGTPGGDHPSRRGRRLVGLAVVAVVMVLVVFLGFGGFGNVGELFGPPDRSAAPIARQDATGSPVTPKDKPRVTRITPGELTAITDSRTKALKAGDVEAFLAGIDPAATDLVADQRRLFANLRLFPFAGAEFRPATESVDPGTDAGPLTREVGVVFAHQLAGVDREPIAEEYRWTLTRASIDGPLLIGKIAGGRLRGNNAYPAPWDEGELALIERPHVLLAVPVQSKAKAQTWADRAETAVKKDLAAWKGPGITPERYVMYVTPDRATFDRALAGSNLPNVEGVCRTLPAARATGRDEPMAGSRITLDGSREMFTKSDARQQGHLMRHEVGHAMVAEFERGLAGPPMWISEGFAEYLAWTEYSLSQWHQPEARKQVDAGKFTGKLPTDADVNSADEQTAAVAYHYSMLAIRYIAEKYGAAKADEFVVAVYKDASRLDEALQAATGLDHSTFEANWAKYVKAKVGS